MILASGAAAGLAIFGLSLWFSILVMKRAKEMPPQEATKYITVRSMARTAVLMLILGLLAYLMGLKFIFGAIGGMVLGMLVFLVVSRLKQNQA